MNILAIATHNSHYKNKLDFFFKSLTEVAQYKHLYNKRTMRMLINNENGIMEDIYSKKPFYVYLDTEGLISCPDFDRGL